MAENEALKQRAAKLLEDGAIFAFGLSQKEHGADVYSTEMRLDPDGARERARAGYINLADRVESRPAVISLNTSLAAQAVTELLARLAP